MLSNVPLALQSVVLVDQKDHSPAVDFSQPIRAPVATRQYWSLQKGSSLGKECGEPLWSKRSSRTSGVRRMILRNDLRLSDLPRLVMVEIRTGGNRSYKSLRRLNVDSRSWRRVKSTQARMNCLDSDGNGRYLNKKHVWPCS